MRTIKNKKTLEKGKVWLKKELSSYRPFILFLCVLTVFSTIFSLAFAYSVRYLINSATAFNKTAFLIVAIVMLGLLFARIGVNIANNYLSERGRAKIITELRGKTFGKILRSDYASIEKYHSGDLLSRLTNDVQEVAVDTIGLLPAIVGMSVQCLGAVLALFTIDAWFTLIFIVAGSAFGGLVTLFRKHIKKYQKELLETDSKSREYIQEGLSSLLTVKAYGAEGKTEEKSGIFLKEYYDKRMKRNVFRSSMSGFFSLLSNFGLIFSVIWCSISIFKGNNDYGSILSVVLLLQQAQQPLTSFSSIIPVFYSRMVSCERLAEIDEICKEQTESGVDSQGMYERMTDIEISDLTFAYDRDVVLSKASMSFEKGKIICVTGASGSGKSTLFRLFMSVYKPLEGNIYINCKDDKTPLTEKDRGLFAYVPQGNFLFSGTIYENLTFFSNEKPTENEIKQAMDIACAQFVYELPNGLNTNLSERGAGLSEGQLQRLAIARALLSNRPILLLDESTSALDAETEKALLQNLKGLKEKTCFIVTHRPAALEIADKIVKVEDGKIVI